MRYVTPGLEGNTVAYKGRRFWIVELADDGTFQNVDRDVATARIPLKLFAQPVP